MLQKISAGSDRAIYQCGGAEKIERLIDARLSA
jgi:hypothetical protein